jgi:trk system potassium uptake protein TrkA
VAHSVFEVPRKIARLRSQSYLDAIYSDLYRRDHMPIEVVISPEREVADAALKRLSAAATFDTEFFLEGKLQLIGITLDEDCPVVNTPLRQLSDLFSTLRAVVVGVRREGTLFAPEPGDQLFVGDDCYVMVNTEDFSRALEIFGKQQQKQERVVLIGGGNVGRMVAQKLEDLPGRAIRAKMIERDRKIAEKSAEALERTIVLNGDGLDASLLQEAGATRADAVLAVTDDDKTNILGAVRAKSMGCKLAVALINDPTLVPLMTPLGIDAYINPRATTVSSILRHIRHGRVRDVYSLGDAEAEIIEAEVLSTSPIAGKQVRDIDFPEGVLIGGIKQGDKIVKPTGATRVNEGDIIALFALSQDVGEVERLLQVSIDYF